MGSSIRPGLLSATAISKASTLSASARIATEKVVDLEATRTKATIVRGTEAVETPVINLTRASGLLDAFVPVRRTEEARAVKQTIVAGTLVARGTTIDLEFLAPALVVLGIFDGVHADLRASSVLSVASLLDDPEVSAALKKGSSELTATERQNVGAKFAAAHVTIDDAVPEKSMGAAFAALKSAQAFR